MTKLSIDHIFPTLVVGSLPRPQWIRDLIEDKKAGRVSEHQAKNLLDTVIPGVIKMQERAGLDFVSDGEWRRESYIKVFSEAVEGFRHDISEGGSSGTRSITYPAVVSKLKPLRPIAVPEVSFLKDNTTAKIIVAIPSPYTISRRMWVENHSAASYPTQEAFMEACIPIIHQEIQELARMGVDAIQLDDPWLSLLVDPNYRERARITNVDHEIEQSIRGVNGAIEGIDSVHLSVHLCHAHFNRQHGTSGPYDLIMDALGEMNVDRFAMEFATPDAGGINVLRNFPSNKTLGLGVIDHTDVRIETPEDVLKRVEKAIEFLPLERITINPDCGFSPSSANPMDLDEAYLKLQAMCCGARLLREKYG